MRRVVLVLLCAFEVACARVIGADFDDAHSAAPLCDEAPDAHPARTGADGGSIDLSVAMESVNYGDAPSAPPSMNLCVPRPASMASRCLRGANVRADDGKPRDTYGDLLSDLEATGSFGELGSAADSARIHAGRYTILLRVRRYNGEKDDRDVDLDWYVAGDSTGGAPKWDGHDAWPVSTGSVKDERTFQSTIRSTLAYVTGYQLVAELDAAPFIGSAPFPIAQLFVRATLQKAANEAWTMTDGRLVGRVRPDDILANLSRFPAGAGSPQCAGDPLYAQSQNLICGAVDVPLGDAVWPDLPCDAISFRATFTAAPVQTPTSIDRTPPAPNPCAADADDGAGGM